jgi:hypothetical protein
MLACTPNQINEALVRVLAVQRPGDAHQVKHFHKCEPRGKWLYV